MSIPMYDIAIVDKVHVNNYTYILRRVSILIDDVEDQRTDFWYDVVNNNNQYPCQAFDSLVDAYKYLSEETSGIN